MPNNESNGISCIILAAGENARLRDIVAPYNKPLILVNGRPLIRHAMDHATDDWDIHHSAITVVASPHNIQSLTQLLPHGVNWVIQPKPTGPVDAISRALSTCEHDAVLILCADNTFEHAHDTPADLRELRNIPDALGVIGTRWLHKAEAERFTQLVVKNDRVRIATPEEKAGLCWIGPLGLNRERIRSTINNYGSNISMETLIECAVGESGLIGIPMLCTDMGITNEHK